MRGGRIDSARSPRPSRSAQLDQRPHGQRGEPAPTQPPGGPVPNHEVHEESVMSNKSKQTKKGSQKKAPAKTTASKPAKKESQKKGPHQEPVQPVAESIPLDEALATSDTAARN